MVLKALVDKDEHVEPRRFIEGLRGLRDYENIIITQADKCGGVFTMNKSESKEKRKDLINDRTAYEEKPKRFIRREACEFKTKEYKRNQGREETTTLVGGSPKISHYEGLSKIHKHGIPMRPITPGIGSAPYRLA